jgi:hypothetical protein
MYEYISKQHSTKGAKHGVEHTARCNNRVDHPMHISIIQRHPDDIHADEERDLNLPGAEI